MKQIPFEEVSDEVLRVLATSEQITHGQYFAELERRKKVREDQRSQLLNPTVGSDERQ